jgi:AbrB family looped-hinge helix DNA binding protein
MRTTIDRTGRVVIPKPLRDAAGLTEGIELEIELRDGRIELQPAPVEMRLLRTGDRVLVQSLDPLPPLTQEAVRDVLERVRR